MGENRKIKFYLEKIGDGKSFEEKVKNISGVLNAQVDEKRMVLTYELDDLASDYDAFAAVVQAAEDSGSVIDFEKTDKDADENAAKEKAETLNDGSKAKTTEVLSAPVEEAEALSGETIDEKTDGDGAKSNYDEQEGEFWQEPPEEEKGVKKKKPRRALSETAQSLIELAIGVAALILGFLIKSSYGKLFMYALAFAVSGYELIYDVICDFSKKRFLTPKFLVVLGIVATLFLGYAEQAVAVTLAAVAAEMAARGLKTLVLKKTAAKNIDEKVTIIQKKNGKTKEKEVRLLEVKTGDELSIRKGEICPFNAKLTSPLTTVLRSVNVFENGKTWSEMRELELKKGAKVLKGDEFLSNSTVSVSAGFLSELDLKQKDLIARVEQKTAESEFIEKRGNLVCGCVLAALAAITFIAPAFASSYISGLYRWGYACATIAVLCGVTLLFAASSIAGVVSLAVGYEKGVMAFDQKNCVKAAKCKTVALDYENALCSGGELKADAIGAARELKDCGKKLALLTLLGDEEANKVCKQLKISEYYCFKNESEKQQKIKELQSENVLCVTGAEKAEGYFIALSYKNALAENKNAFAEKRLEENLSPEKSSDESGSEENIAIERATAYIESDEIAFVPYVYKLALKATKTKKFSFIFGVIVKAALAVLAAIGITQIWWVALTDVLVGVVCCAVSVLGIKEIK